MIKERLPNGIQDLLAEAGESACYALCLIDVAVEFSQKHIDVVSAIISGIERGYIHYDWDNREDEDNFFVIEPESFLRMLTGKQWTVTKQKFGYVARTGDYKINRWERTSTGKVIGHFQRDDFDPLANSVTVRRGHIVSYRICRAKEEQA